MSITTFAIGVEHNYYTAKNMRFVLEMLFSLLFVFDSDQYYVLSL